jgi:catechol 2,3-dioxygenase-like lactoylglutathione lyase family enzyme
MIDIRGIDNVLFPIGDLDAAVHFYADALGLPLVFRLDGPGVALFRLGPEAPGLLVRRDDVRRDDVRRDDVRRDDVRRDDHASAPAPGPRVWLEVDDARQAARALAEAGVEPLGPPFAVATGWTVEIADPWGNVVGFTDYTSMPERGRGRAEP